ncbi:MAG TPA: hypothetical protein VMD91_03700 [Candidatus Sulfotelmatobacter sp.]|nr:hypothetical protein [Candidatus Sulfotelmatobacter sp.]
MRLRPTFAFLCAALVAAPLPALAWGAQGHQMINGAAMATLPDSLPPFLRTRAAHDEVELLGPEPDRLKGDQPFDADESPGHYVDVSDDDTIDGIPLAALPRDRRAYDTALRAATPPSDQYGMGFLPYSIADGYERVLRDLAYWRVDTVGMTKAPTQAERDFFAYDRSVREQVTLRDIGVWGHFVGDASQPLHVTVHFNGWNSPRTHYPNPKDYSDSNTVHARWETDLVRAVATEPLVRARVAPVQTPATPILAQVGAYLTASASFVPAVYELEAAGGIDGRSPAATSLVLDRLAAGASELRDLIVEAWVNSANEKIGYPGISVHDVEAGTVVPTRASVGLGD